MADSIERIADALEKLAQRWASDRSWSGSPVDDAREIVTRLRALSSIGDDDPNVLVAELRQEVVRLRALSPAGDDEIKLDVLRIPRSKSLDPITVYFEDHVPGVGRVTIACYGDAWTAAWSAMGERTVRQFIADVDAGYLSGAMLQLCGGNDRHRSYTDRVAAAVIAALAASPQQEPLPSIDALMPSLGTDDPAFSAWRDSVPDKHWAKMDLSALRIGYELGKLSAAPQPQDRPYPECSGDPMDCPENEGFGCCKTVAPPARGDVNSPSGQTLAGAGGALDAIYTDFCAKDNGDVPLERYPQGAVDALARAGWAVVPCDLPFAVLGDAAQAGVFETGNPKHGWDYLVARTRIWPNAAATSAGTTGDDSARLDWVLSRIPDTVLLFHGAAVDEGWPDKSPSRKGIDAARRAREVGND